MPRLTLRGDIVNRVYRPYFHDQRRYQVYFGGSGSGKSVFLATRCVLDALSGRNVLVVRKVAKTLKGSCWNEVLKAMERLSLASLFTVSKNDLTLTARNNGAQILFMGLDDVEKLKSLTPKRGVLTDIWMEEATECTYGDFKQLDKRLRGKSRHAKRLTLSLNPVWQSHWIYKEFFSVWQDGRNAAGNERLSILKTTYRDNRFLTPEDREALENESNPYYYQVYTLGNWGVPEGAVFQNWRTEELSAVRDAWPIKRYGLDFGFSSDPCGVVECAVDEKHRRVYVFREICKRGLTNRLLAERLDAFLGKAPVICDSSEPKSIQELKSLGIRALAARKGPDSVLHGIQWLQDHEIVVDPQCEETRRELSAYRWQQDKSGECLPIPEDRNNHLMDALRYALEDESTRRVASTGRKKEWGL